MDNIFCFILLSGKKFTGKDYIGKYIKSRLKSIYDIKVKFLHIHTELKKNKAEILTHGKTYYYLLKQNKMDKIKSATICIICIMDIKYQFEINYFETLNVPLIKIRVKVDNNVKKKRGWSSNIDQSQSVIDLDNYNDWDYVLDNSNDGTEILEYFIKYNLVPKINGYIIENQTIFNIKELEGLSIIINDYQFIKRYRYNYYKSDEVMVYKIKGGLVIREWEYNGKIVSRVEFHGLMKVEYMIHDIINCLYFCVDRGIKYKSSDYYVLKMILDTKINPNAQIFELVDENYKKIENDFDLETYYDLFKILNKNCRNKNPFVISHPHENIKYILNKEWDKIILNIIDNTIKFRFIEPIYRTNLFNKNI